MKRRLAYLAVQCLAILVTLSGYAQQFPAPRVFHLTGDIAGTHDPAIIKQGDTWYVFATGRAPHGQLPIRCSKDLEQWKLCGQVFESVPDWIRTQSPDTKDLWAPDVSYFNGKYHVYYAFSAFGKNTSGIALVTNKTLDSSSTEYHWRDEGLVLRSRAEDDFNAIDPNVVFDSSGHAWLSFGSFWTGIKMRRIDRGTGKLSGEDTELYSLAGRERPRDASPGSSNLPPNWQAIEAPFIIRHDDFYYLFVSFDLCCRGIKSTYRTMVGRSRTVTGPYQDAGGKPMMQGGATPLLVGNARWFGPGGESILQGPEGDIIVFHAYDGKSGRPALQISPLVWSNGWPHAALADDSGMESK